jgi:hypothetical protein
MPHVHPFLVAQLLALLILVNGTPVIATKILGTVFAHPLDGGTTLADGQPLFGHSKTIRGVVLSIVVTTSGAPWIGLDWPIGLLGLVRKQTNRALVWRSLVKVEDSG